MPFKRFVETGRVAVISDGPDKGKLCSIVDVIDQTRVLVDGPATCVKRGQIRLNQLHLTKFRIKFPFTAPSKLVRKSWNDAKINEKWAESMWAKKIEAKRKRAEMGDFDRFKLRRARQKRNTLRTAMYHHIKMKASRNGTLYDKKKMTKGGDKPRPKKLKKTEAEAAVSKTKPAAKSTTAKPATSKPAAAKPAAPKQASTKPAKQTAAKPKTPAEPKK